MKLPRMINPKSPVVVAALLANALWVLLTAVDQWYRGIPAW
jgi:hypothetical protein